MTSFIFLWLLCGTLVYRYSAGFTTAQAFYFATQSGFSVGFGAPQVTTADAHDVTVCQWYTTVHVLVGSSLIATALGMWASVLVHDSHHTQKELARQARRAHLKSSTPQTPLDSTDGSIAEMERSPETARSAMSPRFVLACSFLARAASSSQNTASAPWIHNCSHCLAL